MSADTKLIARFRNGDQQAFDELVLRHQADVRGFLFSATRNEGDSHDLAQDVFIKVYNQLHRFRGEAAFSTWLYRIMSNILSDYFRRRKLQDWVPLSALHEAVHENGQPEFAARRNWLMDKLPFLSRTEHQVVILHSLQDLPIAAVAQILGTSENVVKVSYHRAKQKLRRMAENE